MFRGEPLASLHPSSSTTRRIVRLRFRSPSSLFVLFVFSPQSFPRLCKFTGLDRRFRERLNRCRRLRIRLEDVLQMAILRTLYNVHFILCTFVTTRTKTVSCVLQMLIMLSVVCYVLWLNI